MSSTPPRSPRALRLAETVDSPTLQGSDDLAPRWRGERGRLEVWYSTLTDPATGTGVWLHHELVAPTGGGEPQLHGWAAVFPPGEPPTFARFGPHPWRTPRTGYVVDGPSTTVTPGLLVGEAGGISWELSVDSSAGTLFTFPRWAWKYGLLPAAQIVPQPGADFHGTVRFAGRTLTLAGARGATAHIYGHGNAQRWAWLHADLGDGDIAEVVAAVSTRPLLRHLPPLPFLRLRIGGREWPSGDPLLAALRLHAQLDFPTWQVWGRIGEHRVRLEVTLSPHGTVAVDYADPDGRAVVCRNSERADAVIVVEQRRNGRWHPHREWRLTGTAHAEIGTPA